VAEALAAATSPAQISRVLVDRLGPACEASFAALYLRSRSNELRLARGRGFGGIGTRPQSWRPFAGARPLLAAVCTGRTHWYRNRPALIAAHPDFHVQVAYHRVESMAALPLLHGGQVLGVFMIGYGQPHAMADDELELLLVRTDLAARALARVSREKGRPGAIAAPVEARIRFDRVSARPPRWMQPRTKTRTDLGRLVRLISRRQLRNSGAEQGAISCAVDGVVVGRWDRAWLEATLRGLFSLTRALAGAAPVQVHVAHAPAGAVVEWQCGAAPAARRGQADLAAMTQALEEWTLARWLWQAAAAAGGARALVLRDEDGPRGVRLQLPH
jgi:hypothetical protein